MIPEDLVLHVALCQRVSGGGVGEAGWRGLGAGGGAAFARALFVAAQFTDDEATELTDARLARHAILERSDPLR